MAIVTLTTDFGSADVYAAAMKGSQNNDEIICRNGAMATRNNFAGGISGGISSGEPIVVALVAAGGNINPEGVSMFEPIGGSAPKYTGKGVINPLAAICAGSMMLDFLGEAAAAKAIETAVIKTVREKLKTLAAGKMGYGTKEVGDLVAAAV